MQVIGGTLYVTVAELAELGLSEQYIKVALSRSRKGNSTSWQHINSPEDKRMVLIDYETIPTSTVNQKQLPAKEILVQQFEAQQQKQRVKRAQVAAITLASLVEIDTKELSLLLKQESDLAYKYARYCGWLKLLMEIKPKKCAELGFKDKEALYDAALEHMREEFDAQVLPGQRINNKRVLKRKVQAYKLEGASSVLTKRIGNNNAKKMLPVQESLLIKLYSDFKKPGYEEVFQELSDQSGLYGWPSVSLSTVKAFLNKPEVKQIWYLPRHGMAAWRNMFDPIIKRKAPSFANAYWVMDGTPLELYFREGKSAYNRFEIFVILDAHSWKVVGYSVGRSENTTLVRQALRMACTNEGYLPYQLQYDNSSAIKSKESQQIIQKLAPYCSPAQVGNARSKIIEPFFKHFNKRVLKYYDNYSGSNITAKDINSHINRDALTKNFKDIPTENEALEQIHTAIAIWNNQERWKGNASPSEAYENSVKETEQRQRIFTEELDVDLFYHMPDSFYTYTNRGFDITYRKERYEFDVEDTHFRAMNIGASFQVKFNPDRLDRIYLYQMSRPVLNEVRQHVYAKAKTALPMAIVDRVAGDQEAYNKLAKMKDDQLRLVQSKYDGLDDVLPESAKVPLTVERVHKNSMNKVRRDLKALEKKGEKTTPMPVLVPFPTLYDDEEEGPLQAIN